MNLKKSLQTLKENLSKKEAALKAIQQTHPHLVNLSEVQILAYFEVSTIPELNEHIKRIKESIQNCDTIMQKDSSVCNCTDNKGHPKDLYISEESAQREANILATQKNLNLSIYPCPHLDGWHLTKG